MGRHKHPDPRDQRVPVYLTVAELAAVNARRGTLGASEWIARTIGVRESFADRLDGDSTAP